MVDVHLGRRGIHDREVLAAMREVPREVFVGPGYEEFAYEDGPLPIAEGQTISQPYIVAFMLEMSEIGPGDQVLEVGTGSGYAAAVMSRVVDHVYTIERHAPLAEDARRRFQRLGYGNIEVRIGDGTKGCPKQHPSTPSWWRRADRAHRWPCSSSSTSAAGWSFRWATIPTSSGCLR